MTTETLLVEMVATAAALRSRVATSAREDQQLPKTLARYELQVYINKALQVLTHEFLFVGMANKQEPKCVMTETL